jgi:hypothetical protein
MGGGQSLRCMSGELWSCCASSADVGTTESASMASVNELPTKSSRLCSWESEGMRGIEDDVARPDDMARGAPRGVEGPAPVPSVSGKSCRLGVSRESKSRRASPSLFSAFDPRRLFEKKC